MESSRKRFHFPGMTEPRAHIQVRTIKDRVMPRKHTSSTTQHYAAARKLADELRLARIDAAVVEYAELLMDIDNFDFREVEQRLKNVRKVNSFPPTPKWILKLREERAKNAAS